MVLIRWLELIGVTDDIWTNSFQEETLCGTNLVKDALKGWHLSFYHKTEKVCINILKQNSLRVDLLFRRRYRRYDRNSHFYLLWVEFTKTLEKFSIDEMRRLSSVEGRYRALIIKGYKASTGNGSTIKLSFDYSLPGCSTWTLVIFAVRGLGHPEHPTCWR